MQLLLFTQDTQFVDSLFIGSLRFLLFLRVFETCKHLL